MGIPGDAVETSTSFFWLDDGIVHIQRKETPATAETTAHGIDIIRGLIGEVPRPLLIKSGWAGGIGLEVWPTALSAVDPLLSAIAVVGEFESAELDAFRPIINQLLVPFQVFTDESEALAFLREYLPGE